MSELRVVLPTRGRPESLRRFVKSFYETAELPADLTVVLDEDDAGVLAVAGELSGERPEIELRVLPRCPTAPKVNHGALPHLGEHKAIMFLGDDNVFHTHGWDRRIITALDWRGGTGMVYVNDLGGREGVVATNVAVSTDITRALGYFDHPSMSHFGVDVVWTELGQEAGCMVYLPDVVIEHLHPIFGKSPVDQLYSETMEKYWGPDEAAVLLWRQQAKAGDLAKVRGVMAASGR